MKIEITLITGWYMIKTLNLRVEYILGEINLEGQTTKKDKKIVTVGPMMELFLLKTMFIKLYP